MNDTDDKKKYQRLFTKEEFAGLTRDGMYQALCYVSPTLAKGRSRAKKEELIELYQDAADTDSIPVLKVKEDSGGNVVTEAVVPTADPDEQDATFANPPTLSDPSIPPTILHVPVVKDLGDVLTQALGDGPIRGHRADHVFEDEANFVPATPPQHTVTSESKECSHCGGQLTEPESKPGWLGCLKCDWSAPVTFEAKLASTGEHVHGPDCGHDHLPQLAGMDDLVRVNPEMPSAMMQDGAVIQLQPEGEPMFTFKDAPRELTSKEQVLLDRLRKNFDIFTSNVVNNEAKRNVRADIYALKVCGIIANPKFEETIKSGRDHVRELRRKWKAGVDIAEAVKEGNQESKLKSAIAGAMGSGT